MKEPVVNSEDSNLEYNLWGTNYLQYKGELFTGTLLYDDTIPNSYTEYTNGDYDGNSITYYKNGQLSKKSFYKNGAYISGKEWYENGQLRHNSEIGCFVFDEDGILTIDGNIWFYKNGKIRKTTEDKITKIYSENGHLAIITEPIEVPVNSYPTLKITYYHKILKESYKNLFHHIYIHHEDNVNFRQSIFVMFNSWIIELCRTDYKKEAIQIINTMINDSEERLNENLDFRIQSLETNFIHNSKIFLKRIKDGEFDFNKSLNPTNELSRIIF